MSDPEEIIRSYHRAFRARMAAAGRELADGVDEGRSTFSGTLSSLGEDVVRYIQANEVSLFPAVAPLLVSEEEVMAPMILDIRAIDETMNEAEELSLLMLGAPDDAQRESAKCIERLAAQLDAIIRLHLEKLEHIYLPLLRELPPDHQKVTLDRLAAECGRPPEWPEAVPAAANGMRRAVGGVEVSR